MRLQRILFEKVYDNILCFLFTCEILIKFTSIESEQVTENSAATDFYGIYVNTKSMELSLHSLL